MDMIDFTKFGKGKEGLRKAILAIVQMQIDKEDPPETKQTLNRLIAAGYSHDEAMSLLGRAAMGESYFMFMGIVDSGSFNDFNMKRYVANLHRLPEDPVDLEKDV